MTWLTNKITSGAKAWLLFDNFAPRFAVTLTFAIVMTLGVHVDAQRTLLITKDFHKTRCSTDDTEAIVNRPVKLVSR